MNSDFVFYSAENTNTINKKEKDVTMNSFDENARCESKNYELAAIIPHCPVMLVLDTSHSMWGQGLVDMRNSLIAFYKTIDTVSFSNSQIDIAAVSMGDRLGMLEEFTPFANSLLPQARIRPKGYTPMAAALELALQKLQEQISVYQQNSINYVTPQLIILSDGDSSDDIGDVASRINRMISAGELFVRTIAMGENPLRANLMMLGGELVEPAGELPGAFEDVGQRVSMVYEAEVAETILDDSPVNPSYTAGEGCFIIDGSNFLHLDKYRSGVTLKYIISIAAYMEKNHIPYQVFFDATAPHLLQREEAALYDKLLRDKPEQFQVVPAGTQADAFILKIADMTPRSVVLSNDLYRDYRMQYFWLKRGGNRRLAGMVIGEQIYFPEKSLLIPVLPPEKLFDNCL